ncbi:MAG: hypothetical protein LUF92_08525, partial [Clostridiales bacterium]|nr:hypothetical protein [Clostridiales bacterium]
LSKNISNADDKAMYDAACVYSVKEKNLIGNRLEKTEDYDLLTVIMIYLGKEEESTGVLRLLEVLFSPEKDAEEKKRVLQEDFSIAMTKRIENEVSEMCNLSKGVEELGISKGITIGRTEGIAIGRIKGIARDIRRLMENEGWTVERAMSALRVSKEEKDSVLEELNIQTSKN